MSNNMQSSSHESVVAIICGTRSFMDGSMFTDDERAEYVGRVIDRTPWTVDHVIHGGARGADTAAGHWAEREGVPVDVYEADWDEHGNSAGPIRNEEMADAAHEEFDRPAVVIGLWDGSSSGTRDMLETGGEVLGDDRVFVHNYTEDTIDLDSDDDDSEDESVDSSELTALTQVGGVRAFRIRRDLGVSSIPEVADLSIDQLQAVWSVGPMRAKQISGSAQGWVDRHSSTFESDGRRVALIIDDQTVDDIGPNAARKLIDGAIEMAPSISITENTTVRWLAEESVDDVFQMWYDTQARQTQAGRGAPFEIPFDKYAKFTDEVGTPYWQKWGYEEEPVREQPSPDDLPGPVEDRVEFLPEHGTLKANAPLCAFIERRLAVIDWAHYVIIVAESDHMSYYRDACEGSNVSHYTAYDVQDGVVTPYHEDLSPEDTEQPDDGETIVESLARPGLNAPTWTEPAGEASKDDDGDDRGPDYDPDWVDFREGSVEDLAAEDEHLDVNGTPMDTVEDRDTEEFKDGQGPGSREDIDTLY